MGERPAAPRDRASARPKTVATTEQGEARTRASPSRVPRAGRGVQSGRRVARAHPGDVLVGRGAPEDPKEEPLG